MEKYLLKNINKRSIETTIEKSDIVVTKKTKLIRNYSETYLEYGFIDCGKDSPRPLCVLCLEKLSNESVKPNKLKRHLETKHPNDMNKSLDYFMSKKAEYIQQIALIINLIQMRTL